MFEILYLYSSWPKLVDTVVLWSNAKMGYILLSPRLQVNATSERSIK